MSSGGAGESPCEGDPNENETGPRGDVGLCRGTLVVGSDKADELGTRVSLDTLAEQAGKIVRTRPDVPVFVRGDAKIAYGRVIEVMGTLQVAGARSVGLLTEPPRPKG